MEVFVTQETGWTEALFGLGLSFGITSGMTMTEFTEDSEKYTKLFTVARKLAHRQGGHNKFLESISVWLDINAPLFWWSEFDTYRVGTTKQSESTMHTLGKYGLTQKHFEFPISEDWLKRLNEAIKGGVKLLELKNQLPTGFLQRRIVATNLKVLQNVLMQRLDHKLPQWQVFHKAVSNGVKYSEFLDPKA